jgi:hypothetical protein
MTLEEAKRSIGKHVTYQPRSGRAEQGVITSVNRAYVFVRYDHGQQTKATRAEDLTLRGTP